MNQYCFLKKNKQFNDFLVKFEVISNKISIFDWLCNSNFNLKAIYIINAILFHFLTTLFTFFAMFRKK